MNLPDYWLKRPATTSDRTRQAAFDRLIRRDVAPGGNTLIDYDLAFPKWEFLCHAADHCGLVLHGSGDLEIDVFEPRQAADLEAFGAQRAVYAASDGIWPMFFAVADRNRFEMSILNACIRVADEGQDVGEPLHVFSISKAALARRPWRAGAVYLLPRSTFAEQPAIPMGHSRVRVAQLASPEPVAPLARLPVVPEDFPFLAQVRGHDDALGAAYMRAVQSGGPWPD